MNEFTLQPQRITERHKFKTYEGVVIEDLGVYVTEWLEKNEDHKISIHIGCDSHVGTRTKYVTSLCFLREGKGGHIVTKEDFAPKDMSIIERLENEIVLSLETAETLKHLGLEITIHVDYNPNPQFKSNELYATGLGTGAWFGYKTLGKPYAWASSKCADKTTRTKVSRRYHKKKRRERKRFERQAKNTKRPN